MRYSERGQTASLSLDVMQKSGDKMDFTYYGDLLGISGYYKLSPDLAKNKLSDFYNTVFSDLSNYCNNRQVCVHMFSDSLLIYGDDPIQALEELHHVYVKLIHKGLLLRGAIVNKKLKFQIRTELENFTKQLPGDDALARAVGLESSKKGARLLIEPELAESILANYPEWLTIEGYVNNQHKCPYRNLSYQDIKRKIIPTPKLDSYELLYFWIRSDEHHDIDYNIKIENLNEIKDMLGESISIHYRETINLLRRCNKRQKFTKRILNEHNQALQRTGSAACGVGPSR